MKDNHIKDRLRNGGLVQSPGLKPSLVYTPVIPALRKADTGGSEFKAILSYMVSGRPVWAT